MKPIDTCNTTSNSYILINEGIPHIKRRRTRLKKFLSRDTRGTDKVNDISLKRGRPTGLLHIF